MDSKRIDMLGREMLLIAFDFSPANGKEYLGKVADSFEELKRIFPADDLWREPYALHKDVNAGGTASIDVYAREYKQRPGMKEILAYHCYKCDKIGR